MLGQKNLGSFVRGDLLTAGGCAALRHSPLAHTCQQLIQGQLHLPRIGTAGQVPVTTLHRIGTRGILDRDLGPAPGRPRRSNRGPFDFHLLEGSFIPEYPALWNHRAQRETGLVVQPDTYGLTRSGQEEKAHDIWAKYASTLHITVSFSLNSQPLTACVTSHKTLGGSAWPNFIPHKARHESALLLWLNSSLGLMLFWWEGTLQQAGKATLKLSRQSTLSVLDTRALTGSQLDRADMIRTDFEACTFLPANEAWRDPTRQDLDRALLIDLLELPASVLEPLAVLRRQWCAEPSVYGSKWRTAPPEVRP